MLTGAARPVAAQLPKAPAPAVASPYSAADVVFPRTSAQQTAARKTQAKEKAAQERRKAKKTVATSARLEDKINKVRPLSATNIQFLPFQVGNETAHYVRSVSLPKPVIRYVSDCYPYQTIAEAVVLADPDTDRQAWEVIVAGLLLRFDENGNFVWERPAPASLKPY